MSYQIIDEPKTKAASYLIVPPIVILLAAIFLPMYVGPIWLLVNSFLLGSPTFRKELVIIALGSLFIFLCYYGLGHLTITWGEEAIKQYFPYFRILVKGFYFFMLYWVISLQEAPYELFNYFKESKA